MKQMRLLIAIPLAFAMGCGQFVPSHALNSIALSQATTQSAARGVPPAIRGKVKHVIIIIQENRTVDNLFNGFPGADTVRVGKNSDGQSVSLQPTSLTAPFDLSHRHSAWLGDYNDGQMNGFDTEALNCYRAERCPKRDLAAYGYVPKNEVLPYWTMAMQYVFADHMFQSNQGPSFAAHQYFVSGTSTIANGSDLKASENAKGPKHTGDHGGCDSVRGTTVQTIDPQGKQGSDVFPCFTRNSIMDVMNAHDVSWTYYQNSGGPGQWHAVDAVRKIWNGPSYANVMWPSSRVLNDIAKGTLKQVSFVTPSAAESDHPGRNTGRGPAWVATVVNAIGQSSYWKDTAIFVIWDDWGGWYDHLAPRIYNSYELGFRVPMIVIGPYAKQSYVSKRPHEFGSLLKFVEKTFGLPSLETTDQRSDDLSDCFDFSKPPRKFSRIQSPLGRRYFLRSPVDTQSVDDDF